MRLKVISCEVFQPELTQFAEESPHEADLVFEEVGLHDDPDKLRAAIQALIVEADSDHYDYVVLGYALCSNGLAGIRAGSVPLVIPRAHDCITLFLGSRERYDEEFRGHPGTYYYTAGWIATKGGTDENELMKSQREARLRSRYEEYVAKYGEDNAQYLIEQEGLWLQHYNRAALINNGFGDVEQCRQYTRRVAEGHGWEYAELEGDNGLLLRLLNGPWDEDDFLVVAPGEETAACYDGSILCATACAGAP